MIFQTILINPIQAHKALCEAQKQIKPRVMQGERLVLEIKDYEDHLTSQQRRYYHGYVLDEIARQAKPNGEKFPMRVWKEFYRDKYLGTKRISCIDPITKRKSKRTKRVSTEDLGVRGYNKLIDQVTAHASTDLGVRFSVPMSEWVDPNSGEVFR